MTPSNRLPDHPQHGQQPKTHGDPAVQDDRPAAPPGTGDGGAGAVAAPPRATAGASAPSKPDRPSAGRTLAHQAARLYGDRPLHLIVVLGALALGAYVISVLGVRNLFNPIVWWQSIAVWFAVAVIAHDLILYPIYAVADRLISRRRGTPAKTSAQHVALTNYVRIPTLAAGLTLLIFLPGIIEQGAPTYRAATGLTQAPFLSRWLLLTAAFYLASAFCYAARMLWRQRRFRGTS